MSESLIGKRGGYRLTDSFMLSTIIYYATVIFCRENIRSNRQTEQMVQAGRSGRQNLAEGSERSGTSAQSEITLTDVARASLAELKLDFEDFINLAGETPWRDDDVNSIGIKSIQLERTPRGINITHNFSRTVARNRAKFAKWLESDDKIVVANALVRLCDRADYLVRKQLTAQGRQFLEGGGFKERMTRLRADSRRDPEAPMCPKCGGEMALRHAHMGKNAGNRFWGCRNYPECNGLLEV